MNSMNPQTDQSITQLIETKKIYPNQWSSGICDFSSHLTKCMIAAFLPCFQFGENYELMQKLNINTMMDTFNFKKSNGQPYVQPRTCACLTYGAFSLLSSMGGTGYCIDICLQTSMREDISAHQQIGRSFCNSFCCVFLCLPCALTQEYKELKVAEQMMESSVKKPLINSRMQFKTEEFIQSIK